MRLDYQYRIIYRDPRDNYEQYSFTSCLWYSNAEFAIKNFEKEGYNREWITDIYRLIKNKPEPISQDQSEEPILKGYFVIDKGILHFTTEQNVSFKEWRDALEKVRDEINRQLENQDKCPFYS